MKATKAVILRRFTLSSSKNAKNEVLSRIIDVRPMYIVIRTNKQRNIVNHIQVSQQVAKPFYDEKVQPTTLIPKQVGNMYTASLYAAFASLLHNKHNTLVIQELHFTFRSFCLFHSIIYLFVLVSE